MVKRSLLRKVIVDNQQVNVVANEEEIEVKQRIIIYTPTFEGKYVVMDDSFHMIGFKRM